MTTTLAAALTAAICEATDLTPKDVSVSIGRRDDRSTWRAARLAGPSEEFDAIAAEIIADFEPPADLYDPMA
jgi:hypothetical protein